MPSYRSPTPGPGSPPRSCRTSSSDSVACRARGRAPMRDRASASRSCPRSSRCTAAPSRPEAWSARARRSPFAFRSGKRISIPDTSRASPRWRRRRSAPRRSSQRRSAGFLVQRPRRPADETAASAAAVPAEIANARIIIADDNADMREYLTRLLSQNWRVEAVADGGAALAAARRERPDLVLTDVMMPVLDGFGLLRELRADASLASTPVLMLSARAGEEANVEGLQAGADDYLVKPFSSRELLARVSTHLQLHRSREHLDLALKGANLAAWDWNVQTGEFVHNARWAELRGYASDELPPRVESLFDAVHPDDLPRVQQALRTISTGTGPSTPPSFASRRRMGAGSGSFSGARSSRATSMGGRCAWRARRSTSPGASASRWSSSSWPRWDRPAQEPGRRRHALRAGRPGRQAPGRLLRDRPGRGQRRDSTGEGLLFAREEAGARRGVRALAARRPAYADPPAGSRAEGRSCCSRPSCRRTWRRGP